MTEPENADKSTAQQVVDQPAEPIFAGAGRGRLWFTPMRNRVDKVAADLEVAASDAAKTTLDIKFTNGSTITLTDPLDLCRLARPRDVASIRIHFVYEDGSTLTGHPIRQYWPGSISLDDAPDVRFIGTDFAQKETQSRIKGYRLHMNWKKRQAKALAVLSTILRLAWLALVVFGAVSVLFVILGGFYSTSPPTPVLVGMLLLPAATIIPTRRFESPLHLIGTRLKESKRSPNEGDQQSWLAKFKTGHLSNFLVIVAATVVATMLAGWLQAILFGE